MTSEVIENKFPRHVAIIMDGNGRWSEKQGKHRVLGINMASKRYVKQLLSQEIVSLKH